MINIDQQHEGSMTSPDSLHRNQGKTGVHQDFEDFNDVSAVNFMNSVVQNRQNKIWRYNMALLEHWDTSNGPLMGKLIINPNIKPTQTKNKKKLFPGQQKNHT